MILRKPYAVFIKYFKMIHIVMAALIGFLLYRSWSLYNFFRVYSIDYRALSNIETSGVGFVDFLLIVLIIALTIVLFSVMYYKDKPKNLYIYDFVIYFLSLVLFYFCGSAFSSMEDAVLDIKVSKAFRDLYFMASATQLVSFLLTVVRATGFDIKQFDFGTDIQSLNISEKDYEEIEVALQFDQDEIKRNYRKQIRNFKYFYVEHKFIINSIFIIFVLTTSFLTYSRISSYRKTYSQGNVFSTSRVNFSVMDSFLLDSDALGNKLVQTEGEQASTLVVVRFQASSYSVKKLNTGIFNLCIGDLSYSKNDIYGSYLDDLGTIYTNQKLTDVLKTYLAVFEVSNSQASRSMSLKVNDLYSFVGGKNGAKNNYVKLKPIDLRGTPKENESKKIGEKLYFTDSIFGTSSILVNEYEVNNKIRLNYKYCYLKDKCIDSYEYVTPTFTGTYFKTLLRISGELNIDKNVNNTSVNNLRSFLNNFGVIHYKIDNTWHKMRINSNTVKPSIAKTDDYFIEIPLEAKDASELYLTFEIRNQIYKYSLK